MQAAADLRIFLASDISDVELGRAPAKGLFEDMWVGGGPRGDR